MRNKSLKAQVAIITAVTSVLGFVGAAGAAPPTPAEQVGDMATDSAAELVLIVLAVGAALGGLAATVFGVRWVLRAIRNGGRA